MRRSTELPIILAVRISTLQELHAMTYCGEFVAEYSDDDRSKIENIVFKQCATICV